MCNECATNNTLTHRIFLFRFDDVTIGFGCAEKKKMNTEAMNELEKRVEAKIKKANGIEYCILRTSHSFFRWE